MSERDYQQLLQFLYRVPVGLVEIDSAGTIRLMNAYAGRSLMPLAGMAQTQNLFEVLSPYVPQLKGYVAAYEHNYGTIVSNECVRLPAAEEGAESESWYSITVERLAADTYMVAFSDVSAEVEREQRLQEAIDQEAEQRGRMEIAGSVLHDVGNAMAGLSTKVARLLGEPSWRELTELKRLNQLIDTEAEALSRALGAERRSALSAFVGELVSNLEERHTELKNTTHEMAQTLEHVSETLSLQRQYAQEWVSGSRATLNIVRLVEDAVAMQASGFEKRGVSLRRSYADNEILVEGDRTKLVRVFVNLLKNALEAFDDTDQPAGDKQRIEVAVDRTTKADVPIVSARIRDNGLGFDVPPTSLSASPISDEVNSEKPGGTGTGLYAAKRIVEAHGGELSLSSDGIGQGVTAVVTLPRGEEISR